MRTRIQKWGNSLAIRLPEAVVQALELKAGDEIEILVGGSRKFEVQRDRRRSAAGFGGQKDIGFIEGLLAHQLERQHIRARLIGQRAGNLDDVRTRVGQSESDL